MLCIRSCQMNTRRFAAGSAKVPPKGKRHFWGFGSQRSRAGLAFVTPTAFVPATALARLHFAAFRVKRRALQNLGHLHLRQCREAGSAGRGARAVVSPGPLVWDRVHRGVWMGLLWPVTRAGPRQLAALEFAVFERTQAIGRRTGRLRLKRRPRRQRWSLRHRSGESRRRAASLG